MATETTLVQALIAAAVIVAGGLRIGARSARRHQDRAGSVARENVLQTLIIRATDLKKAHLQLAQRKAELEKQLAQRKQELDAELARCQMELDAQLAERSLDLDALKTSARDVPPGGAIDVRRPGTLTISVHSDGHDPRGSGVKHPPSDKSSPTTPSA